jgi:release factor glutamine methyltransferase
MTHVTLAQAIQAIQGAQSLRLERLDAQLLALHALGRSHRDRAWLLAHADEAIAPDAYTQLQALAARRAAGEPLAYITGHKEFYGLKLQVDARVLDPRADTETLVDWALEVMDAWTPTPHGSAVVEPMAHATATDAASTAPPALIDLGTGSGAIALTLKHQRQAWSVHALDYSADALCVAQANAAQLNISVQFQQGAWLQQVHSQFALIVSNPPYIADQDAHLIALTHEPLQALASGADGLDDIRTIVDQAPARLLPGGWLVLEHGYDQASTVRKLLQKAGFIQVQSRLDLAGVERCSGGQWPDSAYHNDSIQEGKP